ncbi:MAG: hypothetical protein COB46_09455 [Rhodospirillaceae bacterium]|nr:MAG: hypothetical protein COB46_09455 [Rhodospirillaceae bacterium]
MNTSQIRKAGRGLRLVLIASLSLSLSGCIVAVPTAFKFISIAADGFSLLATGKTTTDHAISQVTGKDCAMSRALKSEDVCTDNEVGVELEGEKLAEETSLATKVKPKVLP